MMMSRPPKLSTAVATNRSAKSASVTLPTQLTALPPAASIAATVSLAGSASRSFTTTLAPSPASLTAISRPMPRPEPETMATLPSRVPMFGSLLINGSGDGDGGFAGQGDSAVGQSHGQLEGGQPVLDRHHPAGAGRPAVHRGDRGEPHPVGADPFLRHPVGEQPAEVGHGQHAVREDVVQPGGAGHVEVDVDRVVVPGGAGEQRQRGAGDRRQLQRRQLDAHAHLAGEDVGHRTASGWRTTTVEVNSATAEPSALVTSVCLTMNSNAPPFLVYTSVIRGRATKVSPEWASEW